MCSQGEKWKNQSFIWPSKKWEFLIFRNFSKIFIFWKLYWTFIHFCHFQRKIAFFIKIILSLFIRIFKTCSLCNIIYDKGSFMISLIIVSLIIVYYYYSIFKWELNIIMSWIPFRYDQNALRETVCQSLVLWPVQFFATRKLKRTWWFLNMHLFKDIENGFHRTHGNLTVKWPDKNHRLRNSQRNEKTKRTSPNGTKGKYINSTEWNIRNGDPRTVRNMVRVFQGGQICPNSSWTPGQKSNILNVKDVLKENPQLVSQGGNYSTTKIMKMIKK